MRTSSLEGLIAKDKPIRFVDAFIEQLDLGKLSFKEMKAVVSSLFTINQKTI